MEKEKENKSRIKLYRRLVALIATGVSLILITTSCGQKKDDKVDIPLGVMIEEFSDYTGLDEILGMENGEEIVDLNIFSDVAKLEKYLKISEEVNALNIDPIVLTTIEVETPTTLDGYQTVLEEYQKIKDENEISDRYIEKYKLGVALISYGKMANSFLYNYGYDVASKIGLLAVKDLVSNATGRDMADITIPENRNFNSLAGGEIPDYRIEVKTDSRGEKEMFEITSKNELLYNLIGNVYNSQYQNSIVERGEGAGKVYNSSRNKELLNTLDNIKYSVIASYTYDRDKGELIPNLSNSEIKTVITGHNILAQAPTAKK